MFGRGDLRIDPAAVTAGALMALEPQVARQMRDVPSLAERPGTTATPKRGQGHEIREIRPFTEGDDPRHLDAAATARTGSLQIRSFHEDRERTLMLIADFRRPMLWGTRGRLRSVAAAEALVLAGWAAVLDGGAVGVVALTDAGPEMQAPRPRHRGMAEVAGAIARAHERAVAHRGEVRPLAPDLLRAARQVPRGAGIVLATGLDHEGEGLDAALAALRARGPLRLILVEDAFELTPPKGALPYLGPDGPAYGSFAGLPDMRDDRAERLTQPGQRVQRLYASGAVR
ncbi:DUF58 domain-containing protein [Paracoccus caeni]|uniref:DUF58 domain-containing protein n=1 Tax=Paracoccus caeni TaxID=657651 RepID=A0A934SHZ4_9RHOB|nr:DUF58 domain-containing protein [Paracoccus caeni]MBK4218187.1 DUF58 domain-containing protein [Paracoccus caeni]